MRAGPLRAEASRVPQEGTGTLASQGLHPHVRVR